MTFKKDGINEDGIAFKQIEEMTIYFLKNEKDLEKVINKINRQIYKMCGENYFDLNSEKEKIKRYPAEFVIDVHDLITFEEEKERA